MTPTGYSVAVYLLLDKTQSNQGFHTLDTPEQFHCGNYC